MNRPPPPELTPEQKLYYKLSLSDNPFSRSSQAFIPPKTSLECYLRRRMGNNTEKDPTFITGMEFGVKLAETYFRTSVCVKEYVEGLLFQAKRKNTPKPSPKKAVVIKENETERRKEEENLRGIRRLSSELTKSILKKNVLKFKRIDRKKSVTFNIDEKVHFPTDDILEEEQFKDRNENKNKLNLLNIQSYAKDFASGIVQKNAKKYNQKLNASSFVGRLMDNVKKRIHERDMSAGTDDIPSRDTGF